jgi:NAD(P)-dependent dehydrogenase (short-subunit alcohol dehydrogenase family)
MRDLSEAIVFVTGGSRGIGRSLSILLAEAGATVYTCGRDRPDLEETRRQARQAAESSQTSGIVRVEPADVTDEQSITELTDRIRREEGRLDALVNNAGILGDRATIEEYPLDTWRRTMDINVDGVFLTTRESIPLLRNSGDAVIVNISSSVGREGRAEWGAYSVSKCGVEGLTDILAGELTSDGIATVSANPGGTATEMRAEAYPDEDPETLPTSRDVAETLALLIRTVGVGQSGAKYNCRDLFDHLGATTAADLPSV